MARRERSTRIYSTSSPVLFPSSDELEAADTLLLFSLLPVMATKACHSSSGSSFPNSTSHEDCLSHSSISDSLLPEATEPQMEPDPLSILSIVASLHLIDTKELQLVAQDLIQRTSDIKNKYIVATSAIPLIDLTSEETATNSLSSDSSSITVISAPTKALSGIRRTAKKGTVPRGQPRLWRCAEEIEEFLMAAPGMVATEAEIRKAIGNGPDTSKALRLLVKQDEVKRLGTGGKNHPYLYMLPKKLGLKDINELLVKASYILLGDRLTAAFYFGTKHFGEQGRFSWLRIKFGSAVSFYRQTLSVKSSISDENM